MHLTSPGPWTALAAVVVLSVGIPSTARAVTPSPRPQEVPISAAQEDTIQEWVPCRRTLPSCISKTLGAMKLDPGESIEVDGRLDEGLWRRFWQFHWLSPRSL